MPKPERRQLPIGAKVLLFPDHPWAGNVGTIESYEVFQGLPDEGACPVIVLEDGSKTTAFKPQHFGRVPYG